MFYFARAERVPPQLREILCTFSSLCSPRPPGLSHIKFNISTVAEKPTILEAGIQKVVAKIWILGRIRMLDSQSDLKGKK
jgi:hypothetical protein